MRRPPKDFWVALILAVLVGSLAFAWAYLSHLPGLGREPQSLRTNNESIQAEAVRLASASATAQGVPNELDPVDLSPELRRIRLRAAAREDARSASVVAEIPIGQGRATIKSIALARDAAVLIVTDGIASTPKSDIADFQLIDLFCITASGQNGINVDSGGVSWNWSGVVVSPGQSQLLACNQLFDLASRRETKRLKLDGIAPADNFQPQPLAFAPDEKSAVMLLHSDNSSDASILGLWDLETGDFERKLGSESANIVNARFLDDTHVLVWHDDGGLEIIDVRDNTSKRLHTQVDGGPKRRSDAQNLTMARIGKTNLFAFAAGSIGVVDVVQDELVFREDYSDGNVSVLPNGDLLYQVATAATETPQPEASHWIRIRASSKWSAVRDLPIQQPFRFFVPDPDGEHVFAVKRDEDTIVWFKLPVQALPLR